MSDTFRTITSTTVGPDAPALHTRDAENDVRFPSRHSALIDSVLERVALPSYSGFTAPVFGPINGLGSIGTYRFEQNDRIARVWLNITVGIIGTTGVNTYKRLVDWVGARIVNNVSWRYRNKTVHNQIGMEQFMKTQLQMAVDKRLDYAAEFGGGLTPAQRSTLAVAAQTFRIPIPTPWMNDETQAPIISALSEPYECVIQLGSLGDIIETDDSIPATVTLTITGTPEIEYERQVVSTEQRGALVSLVQNELGLEHLFKDVQYQNLGNVAIAATQLLNARVDGLRREGGVMLILIRPSTYATAFAGTYFDFDQAYMPNTVQLATSEGDLIPLQSVSHMQRRVFQRLFSARQYPVIPLAFCEDFEGKQLASGSVDFSNVKNGQLTLTWSSALAAALNVEVMWFSWNFIQQQGTEMQRVSA